jgi:hypothetical protein
MMMRICTPLVEKMRSMRFEVATATNELPTATACNYKNKF